MNISSKTDRKGFGFEYTISDMFQSQGYLVRRSVPLQFGTTNQDATDIDVLGIMFTGLFQKHRIVCDCKNKARAKPYERIFWAKGLGEFVNTSNVFVALNKTQSEIIRFAGTGGVKVLTSDIISKYTSSNSPHGLADASYYEAYEKTLEKISKRNRVINNIFSNFKKLYLNENPYLALNIALAYLEEVSKELQLYTDSNDEFNKALRFLACELTTIVGLQLLCICSDVLSLPENVRREHIINKLTFGEMEPRAVKGIIKNAKDLANEIVKSSVPKSVAPKEVDFGEITVPPYTDSLIGLVERALLRPQMYLRMPQLLDFLLFEQGFKGKEYTDEEFIKIFGHSMSDERMKASRNVLAFVKSFCGIDWKHIWEKSNNNESIQPKATIVKTESVVTEEKNETISTTEAQVLTSSRDVSNQSINGKANTISDEKG
ncbi:hypothetical protein [Bacillus chungangensis]|uniref:Restriction endonuclease type IV Mrr domain-containing protein n=1 Tax=Bacillus chungangensis TaxID=587633 RepID=A0ABT9WT18_9BACI|nr:hypothetical protein [Bacillus chungangensis]MDQ0176269.1 hypothetical protein [Bacillus chungangensis]